QGVLAQGAAQAEVLEHGAVAAAADAGADLVAGELEQLDVLRGAEQAAELGADDGDGTAVVEAGGPVDAADQGGDGVRPELLELAKRLGPLLAAQLPGVVLDEAVDDVVEALLLFLGQLREARGEGVWLARLVRLVPLGVGGAGQDGQGEREEGRSHRVAPGKAPHSSNLKSTPARAPSQQPSGALLLPGLGAGRQAA